MAKRITNSYNRNADTPRVGSIWVWELDNPPARCLIEVVSVDWNGEEWWVRTKTMLPNPTYPPTGRETELNDLSRFWEAVTEVRRHIPLDADKETG
jgi:hypothetical protein